MLLVDHMNAVQERSRVSQLRRNPLRRSLGILFAAAADHNLAVRHLHQRRRHMLASLPQSLPIPAAQFYARYPDNPSVTPSGSSSSLFPLLIALISAAAFLLVSYYALSTSSFFRRNNRGSESSSSEPESLIGEGDEYSGR